MDLTVSRTEKCPRTNAQTSEPVIVPVPSDEMLVIEPTQHMVNLTKLKDWVVIIVAVVSVVVAPEFNDHLDTPIQGGVAVAYGSYAIYRPHRQGEQAREAV